MKHLVLLGGGHAHLFVLQRLVQLRGSLSVTLVSPCRWHYYSGMLPGWIAGHYSLAQCRIDLQALASAAGIRFIQARANSIDAARSNVTTDTGEQLVYDLLSLDTGSDTRMDELQGLEGLLPVKPLHSFISGWERIVEAMARQDTARRWRLAVVGGGAAGVELALAVRHALAEKCHVSLVAGESGVLAGNAKRLRMQATVQLRRAAIEIIGADAQVRDGVLFAGRAVSVDTVFATTGPAAPAWLRASGLALDDRGYVLVDDCHRSCSHPAVFAAGDICSRSGTNMRRSGVHAVRAGPVLANNLLAALHGRPLRAYRPRRRVLYLLSCGRRHAIASWGGFSIQGRWVWYWKDWIDRGFIRRFSHPQRGTGHEG